MSTNKALTSSLLEPIHDNNKHNTNMTTPNNTINALQSLVLCYFSTTAPATTALNASASARAANAAGAASNAARVYNTVINAKGTAVGRGIGLQQRTGTAIKRLGLPCPTGGIYLRIRDIAEAQNIFDEAQLEMDVIREDILATYSDLVADLTRRIGSFATEVKIPTATEVASKFTMSMTVINQPVSVSGLVLTGLTEEIANRVRAESDQQVQGMLRSAHAGPVRELRNVLAEFIERMRNAERLHLTQFDKLREEAQRVKALNVLDLPEINDVLDMVNAVATLPDAALTKDERVDIALKAEKASAKADATLAALGL